MKTGLMVALFHVAWTLPFVIVLMPYYTVPNTEALMLYAKVMLLVGLAIIVMSYGNE